MTRCWLLIEIYSLLVTRCKTTRYSSQNSHITRCRSYSLQKFTRYSLLKLLVAKIHSLLVATFARYSLQKLLVARNHSLLVAKFACYSLQQIIHHSLKQFHKFIKLGESFSFFNTICSLKPKNSKMF